MEKKMVLRRTLSAALALSMSAGIPVFVNAEEGKAVCTDFEFQNEYGNRIDSFGADTVAVLGNATVENKTGAEINPYVFVTVKRGGKLVKIVSDTKTIAPGASDKLTAVLENSEDFTLNEDDSIKAMIWNGIEEQAPLENAITLSAKYTTGNVADFDYTDNIIGADRWSYLASNTNTSSDGEVSPFLLCKGNAADSWYLSDSKADNWFLNSDGSTCTEWGRDMIFNYTVGPKTAGKDLKISGKIADLAYGGGSYISVIKTDDTDVNSIEEIQGDVMRKMYFSKSVAQIDGDGSFSVTIPASSVHEGNDIMFVLSCQAGGYIWNKTEITIEAEKPAAAAEITTNSYDDYMGETNEIAPGRWSYLANTSGVLDNNIFEYSVVSAKSGSSWLLSADKDFWNILDPTGIYTDQFVTMMYNYTVDESMAGKELKIKGRLSGEDGRMAILASKDNDADSIEFGANMWTSCYGKFTNYTHNDGDSTGDNTGYTNVSDTDGLFEAVIPADAVKVGTDIVFAIESEYNYGTGEGQTMVPTNFIGVITASDEKTAVKKFEADSVMDFETETNETRPGHWSYYHWTETVEEDMDGEKVITGVKVNNLLRNGNLGNNSAYAGTWAADPNRGDGFVHYIDRRNFGTDARPLAWVYTIKADDFKNAKNGVTLSGQIHLDIIGANVQIFCVNDGLANEVSSEVQPQLLFDQTYEAFSDIVLEDIHIQNRYLKEGTDIIFRITRTSNDIWWVSQKAAFNICEY